MSISDGLRKKPSPGAPVRPSTTRRRAFGLGAVDVAGDLVAVLAGDQRAHLVVGLAGRTDLDRRDALLDLVDQRVGDRVAGEHDGDRHAPLAGRAVGGADRGVGGHVEVGVGQHEHVVLGAAERLHALAVLGAGLVDVLGDRRGADEADRGDVGVLEDAVDGHLVAVDDVEAAVGQTGLLEQLGDEHARRRILLARLEDERVAARQRVGEHPHRHHRREVERRDAGHDTERLLDAVHVDAGARLLAVAALQQVRDPTRELDVLQATRHLAERVAEHLAVLREMREAISLRLASTSSRMWNITSARRDRLVARHAGNAALAEATAASTSAAEARSTAEAWFPVAGSQTTPDRPEVPQEPSHQSNERSDS